MRLVLEAYQFKVELGEGVEKLAEKVAQYMAPGDIAVVASKAVSFAQGRVIPLAAVRPSKRALELARKYNVDPRLAELVLQEADEVLGGCRGFILATYSGVPLANAGIDRSNAPPGTVALPPYKPMLAAEKIRARVERVVGGSVGVIIADSALLPLRRGVTGVALAFAGIEPIDDCRGRRDLFGKALRVTQRNLADMLAAAAEILMGEASEMTPLVVARKPPLKLTSNPTYIGLTVPRDICLYTSALSHVYDARKKS